MKLWTGNAHRPHGERTTRPFQENKLVNSGYMLFGGTFGKWVFSVKVLDASGHALSHSEYGKRLLPIYALGLGLGIPLVCVIPQIIQYVHLRNTGKTFYDEKEGRIVVQYKQGFLKCIVCAAFILLVIGLKAYATGLETGNAGM